MKKTKYNHHRNHSHRHNHHHHHHHHHNNHHWHNFYSPLWCLLCLRSFGSKISHFPSSRLIKFQRKIYFQPRRLSSFLKKKTGKHLRFFKDSLSFLATALIFEQRWIQYLHWVLMWDAQPSYWGSLWKNKHCMFCPHLLNSTLEPNCEHFIIPLGQKGCMYVILGEFWIGIHFKFTHGLT